MLFFGGSSFVVLGKRTRDFAFVSLCYGRSGEEICMGYAMAASGRMQYDYKQTNKQALNSQRSLFCTRARYRKNCISHYLSKHPVLFPYC